MTLYLDTSSVVKLYVEEAGSDAVRQLVESATVISTATIAYTEAHFEAPSPVRTDQSSSAYGTQDTFIADADRCFSVTPRAEDRMTIAGPLWV